MTHSPSKKDRKFSEADKKDRKKSNADAPKKEEVKTEEVKPVAKTVEAVTEEADAEEQDKRKKNPLDMLPKSSFSLDDFKKLFLNTNKVEALKTFWTIYDDQGFSIWFMHYDKTKSMGESLLKASNFKSMYLQV